MRKVDRSELLDLGAYEQVRERFRNRVIALKARRRVALGAHMTLTFENHDTVLLQVQEMLRTERISDERSIAHELATYNELVPGARGLSATLFIEYDDAEERRAKLVELAGLRTEIRLRIAGSEHVARFATHFGEELERIPSVNYLTFDELAPTAAASLLDAGVPAALACTHPGYRVEVPLPAPLREELALDLGGAAA
jgi:hypothetical protein